MRTRHSLRPSLNATTIRTTGAHVDKSSLFWLTKLVKVLKRCIPDLTCYKFSIARHHQLLHGRGAVMPNVQDARMYVAPGQLSHFFKLITSGHIIQGLLFGEKKLRLSSNEELTILIVIKTVILAQIISQYEKLCSEEGFKPMGRSTLYRCPACLLGLCSEIFTGPRLCRLAGGQGIRGVGICRWKNRR